MSDCRFVARLGTARYASSFKSVPRAFYLVRDTWTWDSWRRPTKRRLRWSCSTGLLTDFEEFPKLANLILSRFAETAENTQNRA